MFTNKKIIMSTCTLAMILFGAFLFIQNDNIQIVSEQSTKTEIKAPQIVEETQKPKEKTETPAHTSQSEKEERKADNKTKANIIESKDGQHIREDGWIVNKLGPLSEASYTLHDLSGYEVGKYNIQIEDSALLNINRDNLIDEIGKFVPYSSSITNQDSRLDIVGFYEIKFKINNSFEDIYELEEYLKTVDFIKDYNQNHDILPEYKHRHDLIKNVMILP